MLKKRIINFQIRKLKKISHRSFSTNNKNFNKSENSLNKENFEGNFFLQFNKIKKKLMKKKKY